MAIQLREERIKPFLRWAGGKSWFIEHLQSIINGHEFSNYYEPFLGGGSIFFSLSITDAVATLSDANKELIDTYIAIRDDVEKVADYFETYENTSEFYYKLRENCCCRTSLQRSVWHDLLLRRRNIQYCDYVPSLPHPSFQHGGCEHGRWRCS